MEGEDKVDAPLWREHSKKPILSTITKAMKGSDIFDNKLRAPHALRGETRLFVPLSRPCHRGFCTGK